jgi:biopolymer transport protein ExbB/TolQ
MDEITKLLYWISTGLLIPVIVLLLVFFVRALLLIGTFYGIYIQKLKFNKEIRLSLDQLNKENVRETLTSITNSGKKLLLPVFLKRVLQSSSGTIHYNKLLNDFETTCQKDIAGSQTLAKLGPVLGLMGTLIPMGPALVGLATGDIGSMAANMQVAFATTVIGLLIGAVGFVIMQVKRRWYAADINDLDFVVKLLKKSNKNKNKPELNEFSQKNEKEPAQ